MALFIVEHNDRHTTPLRRYSVMLRNFKENNMLKKILYHVLFWIGILGTSTINVLLLNENQIIYTLIVVAVFAYLLYWFIFHPIIKEMENR